MTDQYPAEQQSDPAAIGSLLDRRRGRSRPSPLHKEAWKLLRRRDARECERGRSLGGLFHPNMKGVRISKWNVRWVESKMGLVEERVRRTSVLGEHTV